MGWRRAAIAAFHGIGGTRIVRRWFGRHRLTVLAYHRVTDHTRPGFKGFAGNVSASQTRFAEQMRWAARHLNPIAMRDVAAAIDGGDALPERPLVVTFDDGYRDNLTEALPILEDLEIPATVFLAIDHIGSTVPFWWDRAAWIFDAADDVDRPIPVVGKAANGSSRGEMATQWIDAVKTLPDGAMRDAVDELAAALEVDVDDWTFESMHLDWDDVRMMSDRGVDFGAHTCRHPILTRVDPDDAVEEISRSVRRVGFEVGEAPTAFAYPNGLEADFDERVVDAVADAGVPLGFTLLPGPARQREYRSAPLTIPRVYVHHHDDLARFAAKVSGVPRILP